MVPDSKGRVMVQGLLTATLPTKLGGDLNYIARKMTFEFLRPVFVGDMVTCEGTVVEVTESEDRFDVSLSFECRNQEGKEVLRGMTEGIIRRQPKRATTAEVRQGDASSTARSEAAHR